MHRLGTTQKTMVYDQGGDRVIKTLQGTILCEAMC